MSGLHQISQNQKAISKEQKKIFDMRSELKKMKEELSKQAMYSQQGDRPSKAAERRESRRMSQLNMDHVVPSGTSLGSGGGNGSGGSEGKKKPSFAYTGGNGGKSGGGKEDVTTAMSNLSVSGAQPKDEEVGGGVSNPLQSRSQRQRASKQMRDVGGGGTSAIEQRINRIKQKKAGGGREGGGGVGSFADDQL